MQAEIPARKTRRLRTRRSLSDRLAEAIIHLAQGQGQIFAHEETPWASITFAGTRHTLEIDFDGSEAVEAGEQFIAALPDHEFAIPGQLVADAGINEVHHFALPQPRMIVTVNLLLLEEA